MQELPPFEKVPSEEDTPKPFLPPAPALSFPRVPAELAESLEAPKLRNTISSVSVSSSREDNSTEVQQATSGDSSEEEALSTHNGQYSELYLRHDRKMRAIFEENRVAKKRKLSESNARGGGDGDVSMTSGENVAGKGSSPHPNRKGLIEVIPGIWRRPLLPSVPSHENIPQLPDAPVGGGNSASLPPNLDEVSPPPPPSAEVKDGDASSSAAGKTSVSSDSMSALFTRSSSQSSSQKRRQVLRIPARIEAKFRMPQSSTYGVFERVRVRVPVHLTFWFLSPS